jgi:hypothetical protein
MVVIVSRLPRSRLIASRRIELYPFSSDEDVTFEGLET